jgi:signal transduction histidine kinase
VRHSTVKHVTGLHPVLTDVVLALAIYVSAILVPIYATSSEMRPLTWKTFLFGGCMCTALTARRRYPRTVLMVVVVATAINLSMSGPRGPLELALMVAAYSAAVRLDRRELQWFALGSMVLLVGAALAAGRWWLGPKVLGPAILMALAGAVGEAVRDRRAYVAAVEERAIRAERTREEEARRRVVEERLRIARELHDVLAHHIAVINVQAGVVAHVLDSEPEQARESLAHIRRAGRSALEELRTTVGLLRQPDSPAPPEPAPGLDRLPELIASFAASGLTVEPEIEGPAVEVPATVGLTAYRIAQEALTNVGKHAPGAPAALRIRYSGEHLSLEVSNPPPPGRAESYGEPGHGLLGMRERALSIGGSFTAGPAAGGGFQVRAELPVAPA